MSTTKDLRLAKMLKILLDFLFGLTILACIALVLWVVLSPLMLRQTGAVGTTSIPVRIGDGEDPQFDVSFQGISQNVVRHAFVSEAEGTLNLETGSIYLIAVSNAAKLVLGGGLIYVFYLLREIVKAIAHGKPFIAETSRKVRRLGFTVLGFSFIAPISQYIAATEILNRLAIPVPHLSPGPTFDATYLFMALLILLLSYVWSYGKELEVDRQLTV
jgi:hypothetical protein